MRPRIPLPPRPQSQEEAVRAAWVVAAAAWVGCAGLVVLGLTRPAALDGYWVWVFFAATGGAFAAYYLPARWVSGLPLRGGDLAIVIAALLFPAWGGLLGTCNFGLLPGLIFAAALGDLTRSARVFLLTAASVPAAIVLLIAVGTAWHPMLTEAVLSQGGLLLGVAVWHAVVASALCHWAASTRRAGLIAASGVQYCAHCGYDLTGCAGPRCPECGQSLPKPDSWHPLDEIRAQDPYRQN